MKEELRVNPTACSGHGLCAELLPELVTLDEWGYPIVARGAGAALAGPARPPGRDRLPRAGPQAAARVLRGNSEETQNYPVATERILDE